MKPTIRDYATILLALLTVFACGLWAGHITGRKAIQPKPEVTAHWEEETLSLLKRSLELEPREQELVEHEIQRAAAGIRLQREETILNYHQRISDLYGRLIEQMDESNAAKLREEKRSLDEKIQALRPKT